MATFHSPTLAWKSSLVTDQPINHLKLRDLAVSTLPAAYAPYSSFFVASAIEDTNGQHYTGVNVENASYGLTICAERAAICSMISDNHSKIKTILILGHSKKVIAPCGACLQVIVEFSGTYTQVICAYGENYDQFKTWHLNELLPHAFLLETE